MLNGMTTLILNDSERMDHIMKGQIRTRGSVLVLLRGNPVRKVNKCLLNTAEALIDVRGCVCMQNVIMGFV